MRILKLIILNPKLGATRNLIKFVEIAGLVYKYKMILLWALARNDSSKEGDILFHCHSRFDRNLN